MISVDQALRLVLKNTRSFGKERVGLESALGRVLAEDLLADRDIPPFNRATMDGIAIKFADFESGKREFQVKAIQAAGDKPVARLGHGECVQIMTGAAVPDGADTVIPIELITLNGKWAKLPDTGINRGQFIHRRGSDKASGSVVAPAGCIVTPAVTAIAASVGQAQINVSRLPRIVVITTGDELVDIGKKPTKYQIRRSNSYATWAVMKKYAIVSDTQHLPDDAAVIKRQLMRFMSSYDAIIISGGVSKGKFDYVPQVLADLSVKTLFHGVKQKPGKPFWFGVCQGGPVVFALPGNPVSTFLCLYKYFLPWLRASLGTAEPPVRYAILNQKADLPGGVHLFLQAKLHTDPKGELLANPINNTGSGDFTSLLEADAFLELPPGKAAAKAGEAYKIIPISSILGG